MKFQRKSVFCLLGAFVCCLSLPPPLPSPLKYLGFFLLTRAVWAEFTRYQVFFLPAPGCAGLQGRFGNGELMQQTLRFVVFAQKEQSSEAEHSQAPLPFPETGSLDRERESKNPGFQSRHWQAGEVLSSK